jgi:hypothetical protein
MAVAQGAGLVAFACLVSSSSRRRGAPIAAGAAASAAVIPYAAVVARHRPYPLDRRGVGRWLVDSTWSAPNTLAGALFLAHQRARGNSVRPDRTAGSGTIDLARAAIGGYATTVGIVVAGSRPRLDPHERVHITQQRMLGPFYGPLVVLDYLRLIVVPTWWRDHDHDTAPIVGPTSYLQRGVYRRVWHERWAYSVAPAGSPPLSMRQILAPLTVRLRRRRSGAVSEWAQQDSNL